MRSRRPDARFNRGRIATVAGTASPGPPVNPVTSGLILELDPSDEYLTYDGSDRISAWLDKSGVGNDGSTAAGFPLRVTGALDGRNAVRFDAATARIARAAFVGGATTDRTVVMAMQKTNNTGAQILCSQSAAGSTYVIRTDTAKWGIAQGATISETGNTADTSPHVLVATFSGTDTFHVDDMVTPLISGNAGATTADGWGLGRSSAGGLFDCYAYLTYDRALSESERIDVKGYLRELYPSLPA